MQCPFNSNLIQNCVVDNYASVDIIIINRMFVYCPLVFVLFGAVIHCLACVHSLHAGSWCGG